MEMRALSTMQHTHLSKRHVGSISLPFMCRSKKRKEIDRIAYSDASVIVIKSRKSKGYAIADTDCIRRMHSWSYYVYDSLMDRETFWKEIGKRGGNAIRMDVSCRIGDRMRQQKHTLEERSCRLQNKRERASQRRSQETSEERSRRLQNARDRQSQCRSQEIFPSVLTTCTLS